MTLLIKEKSKKKSQHKSYILPFLYSVLYHLSAIISVLEHILNWEKLVDFMLISVSNQLSNLFLWLYSFSQVPLTYFYLKCPIKTGYGDFLEKKVYLHKGEHILHWYRYFKNIMIPSILSDLLPSFPPCFFPSSFFF